MSEASSSAKPAEAQPAETQPAEAQWRLKFLHKVGIPPPTTQEAPPILQPSESDENLVGLTGPEDYVVVRQAPPRRSSDDIRLGYIKKLERSRQFIPHLNRPKTAQTVTIFDWDDTLLCTSHLEMVQRQYGSIPTQVREQLATLERIVQTLLVEVGLTE